jgi:biotin carboxylase
LFIVVNSGKQMSRTVSARIPKETHEKLLERCNRAGCTINEWLCACIDYLLTGHSEFDFGDGEENDETKNQNS